jgi:hypothetical protein
MSARLLRVEARRKPARVLVNFVNDAVWMGWHEKVVSGESEGVREDSVA